MIYRLTKFNNVIVRKCVRKRERGRERDRQLETERERDIVLWVTMR